MDEVMAAMQYDNFVSEYEITAVELNRENK